MSNHYLCTILGILLSRFYQIIPNVAHIFNRYCNKYFTLVTLQQLVTLVSDATATKKLPASQPPGTQAFAFDMTASWGPFTNDVRTEGGEGGLA